MRSKFSIHRHDNHALAVTLGRYKCGAVVRALASHLCGPGSNPGVDAICGLILLSVLSLAPRRFSPGTPAFPSPQKPIFPNSTSTSNQVDEEPLCGCATCKSLFIYLFIYFIYLFYYSICICLSLSSVSRRIREYLEE